MYGVRVRVPVLFSVHVHGQYTCMQIANQRSCTQGDEVHEVKRDTEVRAGHGDADPSRLREELEAARREAADARAQVGDYYWHPLNYILKEF